MPRSFEPTRVEAFRFVGYDFDLATLTASLRYALDDLPFEERIIFTSDSLPRKEAPADLDELVWGLHLVAGVSYYKAAAPPNISVETRSPGADGARLLTALYTEGLGEFRYVNDLDLRTRVSFSTTDTPAPIVASPPLLERILIPVGGGKDSIVTIESLRRRHEVGLFAVGRGTPIDATISVAELPTLRANRVIDPRLLELNEVGAYNGHVPVTAIVSMAALVAARLFGFDAVAMSNERSASEPTMVFDGVPVNHQFSKSFEAEKMLRAFIAAELTSDLDYFSFLRPFTEIAIARRFAGLRAYHHAFTSCNRLFRIDPTRRALKWCGNCPKCRFVFLVLAPFLGRENLIDIFGMDLLDDLAQLSGYEELLGIDRVKPFECVGEVDEVRALLGWLRESQEWDHAAVVQAVAGRLPTGVASLDSFFSSSSEHCVPEQLSEDLAKVVADVARA